MLEKLSALLEVPLSTCNTIVWQCVVATFVPPSVVVEGTGTNAVSGVVKREVRLPVGVNDRNT